MLEMREREKSTIPNNLEGSEVRLALDKIERYKTPGPDRIVIERLSALDAFTIDKSQKQ